MNPINENTLHEKLTINGHDLLALAVPEGHAIGEILGKLREMVSRGEIQNNRDSLIETAKLLAPEAIENAKPYEKKPVIKSVTSYGKLKALSNFAEHVFVFDGVQCASMEGLLQSFKIPDPDVQKEVCMLVGVQAKRHGRGWDWRESQVLYWNNVAYPRDSEEYQALLDRAESEDLAILASGQDAYKTACMIYEKLKEV